MRSLIKVSSLNCLNFPPRRRCWYTIATRGHESLDCTGKENSAPNGFSMPLFLFHPDIEQQFTR